MEAVGEMAQAIVRLAARLYGRTTSAHLRVTGASGRRRSAAAAEDMGHASITVTAHVYADLYDDELDDVASAWIADDTRKDLP